MTEVSSWQRRAEWYEKENHRLVKALLRIRDLMMGFDQVTVCRKTIDIIDKMNIESGWNGKDPETDTGKTNPSG